MRPCPCPPPTSICSPPTCWGTRSAHRELRAVGPAVRLTAYDAWALPRYEHVRAALADHERFRRRTASVTKTQFDARMKATVPAGGSAGHTRLRALLSDKLAPPGPWRSSVPESPTALAGEPVRKLNNVIRGFASLPVTVCKEGQ